MNRSFVDTAILSQLHNLSSALEQSDEAGVTQGYFMAAAHRQRAV